MVGCVPFVTANFNWLVQSGKELAYNLYGLIGYGLIAKFLKILDLYPSNSFD